jgi:hypothetical protein
MTLSVFSARSKVGTRLNPLGVLYIKFENLTLSIFPHISLIRNQVQMKENYFLDKLGGCIVVCYSLPILSTTNLAIFFQKQALGAAASQ